MQEMVRWYCTTLCNPIVHKCTYALPHNYCYCHDFVYVSSSRFNVCLLWCHDHLRQKKIWKIIRRRGLAVWWKMFWKTIINIWYLFDQTNNDLVMFRPIHINNSQHSCAPQGTFKHNLLSSKRTYHFLRATLTKILSIKMDIWAQIS